MTPPISVVVADDQSLVRSGFVMLIDAEDDMQVVGEASDGAQAVEVVERTRPGVVLMDVRMPGVDGIEAMRRIAASSGPPAPHVIMLTTFDLDEFVYEALRAGASGFLLKDTPLEDLLSAIRVVAAGDALLAPSVTRRLLSRFAEQGTPAAASYRGLDTLTERERDVLKAVATGASNAEIAEHLSVGAATVKTHVSRLLTKLDARDRTQLVVIAYESGMVRAG